MWWKEKGLQKPIIAITVTIRELNAYVTHAYVKRYAVEGRISDFFLHKNSFFIVKLFLAPL